jgi:hypothetical protein
MILKHWKRGWGYQYLIKWTGYPITEASWEPESMINNDGDMLTCWYVNSNLIGAVHNTKNTTS